MHPYFDNIDDEKWLFAFPRQNQTIYYEVHCPDHWNRVLQERVENSFAVYKLGAFYSIKAAQETAEQNQLWGKILRSDRGERKLKKHFCSQLESIEVYYNNSWRAALYAGLIRCFDTVVQWL